MLFSVNKSTIVSKSIHDLNAVAEAILDKFPDKSIFAFYGEMGAGKTTFIKVLCEVLGVEDVVSSPTFALVNVYHTVKGESVNHFDCYRIKSLVEIYDIGYEDYFFGGDRCLIEWPEKIESLLPEETVKVRIAIDHETGYREFSF